MNNTEKQSNKLNIAVITLPLHYNYGGIMQAYALQSVLKDMGHSVTHIEQQCTSKLAKLMMPLVYLRRIFRKYITGDIWIVVGENFSNTICRNTKLFIEKHITLRFVGKRDFNKKLADEYDVIIVGSDQVWRPQYVGEFLYNAFLLFAEDSTVKRISYSASFGTSACEFSPEQLSVCARLLSKFNAVSVREFSGVTLCKDYFGVNAVHMIDPTMLLTKDHYMSLIQNGDVSLSEGDLMTYILDPNAKIKSYINKFATCNGLATFKTGLRYEDSDDVPIDERIPPKVEHWLRGFCDAKVVITDSFHACVFSIIFNKPFIVIGNKQRGFSRFESLLSMFHLEKCLIEINDLNALEIPHVEWNRVNQILEGKRKAAFDYLNMNLKK